MTKHYYAIPDWRWAQIPVSRRFVLEMLGVKEGEEERELERLHQEGGRRFPKVSIVVKDEGEKGNE